MSLTGAEPPAPDTPAAAEAVSPLDEIEELPPEVADAPPRVRKSRKNLIVILLLGVALLGAAGALTYFLFQLAAANSTIEKQQQKIDEQKDLIDKKETFGAAMNGLLGTAASFEGALMGDVVPLDDYQAVAKLAWGHRWSSTALDRDIATVNTDQKVLSDRLAAASTQLASNSTGTTYEAVSDQLGGGFVALVIDNADTLCEGDVLACVLSNDPYTIHIDAADSGQPYMTDLLKTGIVYHEFAHVLQLTNLAATETALAAFGGDSEVMADCFALTFLDGWTLDHRIFTSSYEYWDVSIGYGVTCDAAQAQVVRDWHSQLGFHAQPISQ